MSNDAETIAFRSGELLLNGRLWRCASNAPTFLLLSGVGFHTFEYELLGAELATRGFNAFSFDYRGHGRSGGVRGCWTLEDLVLDSLRAIAVARERCPGPLALFGNSLGGMVAIMTAVRDEHTLAVAAANAPARIADFLLTPTRRALFAAAKQLARLLPLRISINHFYSYDRLIDVPSWISMMERDRLIADARRLSVRSYKALLEDWDGQAAVRTLHKPLMIIQGQNDRLQPVRQSELLFEAANEPKSYECVDAGHLPHLENPKYLAEVLTGWFRGLIARRREDVHAHARRKTETAGFASSDTPTRRE